MKITAEVVRNLEFVTNHRTEIIVEAMKHCSESELETTMEAIREFVMSNFSGESSAKVIVAMQHIADMLMLSCMTKEGKEIVLHNMNRRAN